MDAEQAPAQSWTKDAAITAVTLPEATGGNGGLTYSLTPDPPAGVTFDASAPELSGKPTAVQEAATYTYTATDTDSATTSLTFSIEVRGSASDKASFVSFSDVPSTMTAGEKATVTVTMKNTGTTTWTTTGGYQLGSARAHDNTTWGLSRVALSSSVLPNASHGFSFTITAPSKAKSYKTKWQMIVGSTWFGKKSGAFSIAVEADKAPSFGTETVSAQTWTKGTAITDLTLPKATGGNGDLTHSLTPDPPAGVTFDASTRVLLGTPTAAQSAATYKVKATDRDGSVAELEFTITVEAPPPPSFGDKTVGDQTWVKDTALDTLTLPAATGGSGTLTYTLTPELAEGLTFDGTSRTISGTPTKRKSWTDYTYTATDGAAESASLTFRIKVKAASNSSTASSVGGSPPSGSGFPRTMTVGETRTVRLTVEGPLAPVAEAGLPSEAELPGRDRMWALRDLRVAESAEAEGPHAVSFEITAPEAAGCYAFDWRTVLRSAGSGRLAGQSPVAVLPAAGAGGVHDMLDYWFMAHGCVKRMGGRIGDDAASPSQAGSWASAFWRGRLWGRTVALLGEPGGTGYDIFEQSDDGIEYWGAYGGGEWSGGDGSAVGDSQVLARPFRWMHRFMAVGDVVEGAVTVRSLSGDRRREDGRTEAALRLEVVAHHASFTVPVADGLTFEDVLEVRFWPAYGLDAEAYDTYHLARGYGTVHFRSSGLGAPSGVSETWAVETPLSAYVPARPESPWFDPFVAETSAVPNGLLEDYAHGVEGSPVSSAEAPGWTSPSADAVMARLPAGLPDSGPWGILLRGAESGGEGAAVAASTEEWIPVQGGMYELSGCMRRESPLDNVYLDLADGKGRDGEFADVHAAVSSVGAWECRAVTTCIPASVGAVRVRAVRDGANALPQEAAGTNVGDAYFDRVELKRLDACREPAGEDREDGTR